MDTIDGTTVPVIGLIDYIGQKIVDAIVDDEEAQAFPQRYQQAVGEMRAYQDVLAYLRGNLRPEYLEAVADRAERRRLFGVHNR